MNSSTVKYWRMEAGWSSSTSATMTRAFFETGAVRDETIFLRMAASLRRNSRQQFRVTGTISISLRCIAGIGGRLTQRRRDVGLQDLRQAMGLGARPTSRIPSCRSMATRSGKCAQQLRTVRFRSSSITERGTRHSKS